LSSAGPALLAAAAGVGFGHAILPDHWMPLAVIGRVERYPTRRVARLATLAGVAHVLVSLVLGAAIIVIGLQFRSSIEHAQDSIVGAILILTGLVFAGLEVTGRGHSHGPGAHQHRHGHEHHHGRGHGHDDHDHDHHNDGHEHDRGGDPLGHDHPRPRNLLAVMVPFGAAASPDLTILPVFLAATAVGGLAAIGSLLIFAAVTIGTIVTLTLLAYFSGNRVDGHWLNRWGDTFTAVVLVAIGGLVITGVV
jgi:nickel/cobalt transporter (NicO) family protein